MYIYLRIIVLSIPFWSIPFLPGTYSAITPYLLSLLFIITFNIHSFSLHSYKNAILCWLIISIIIIYSVISVYNYGLNLIKIIGYFVAIFSFSGFSYIIKRVGIDFLVDNLIKVSKLISVLAIIEQIAIIVKPFYFIKYILNLLFSGNVSAKLLLTTSESSWAVQVLLFCCIFLFYDYKVNGDLKSLILLVLSLFIFLITFSLTGYIVLICALIVYYVFFGKFNINLFFVILLVSIISISVIYEIYTVGNSVSGSSSEYTFSRITKFMAISYGTIYDIYYFIISLDNSVLVRIGYPVVAFQMFMDHPLGLGIGGFSHHLGDYFNLLDTPSVYSSEVIYHIENLNADTRNLFLAIATDFGVFGLLLFLWLLYKQVVILKYANLNNSTLLRALFCLTIGMMMQFSTIYMSIYPLVWSLIFSREYDE